MLCPARVEPGSRLLGIDLGEQGDDGDLRVAVRRRERGVDLPPARRRSPRPTIRRTRARSFSFVAETSTMRLPNVLPRRIIEIVESMFRTSFCAVPALSRVEPARNSGPTTTTIGCSTARLELGARDRDDAGGPRARARSRASSAPST